MHGASSSAANPSGVQGICPTGWHVPSDAEWTQLTDYVSSQNQYVCGEMSSWIAKALTSTTGWSEDDYASECAVRYNPFTNNAMGFLALPAGYYGGGLGDYAHFWSATESNGNGPYMRVLFCIYPDVDRSSRDKYSGISLRCLRD